MLHGWGAHSGIWGALADSLSSRFSLHLVDLPGHGRSRHLEYRADVDALLDEIRQQCPGAHWLGWSLGGLLAMMAALKFPGELGAIVIVSASASFLANPHWPHGMRRADFDAFRAGLELDQDATLRRFIALQAHGTSDAARTRQILESCLDTAPPATQALLAGLDTLAAHDLSAKVPHITNRALLISGQLDKVVSDTATASTAALIAGSEHLSIPGAGHAALISHADEVALRVREFLQEEPAS